MQSRAFLKLRSHFFLLLFLFLGINARAQNDFYEIGVTQEIKIYFDEPNWDYILDSFYVKGDEDRLAGTVIVNGERFEGAGIRYKGFSSVSIHRTKNPFNIKLDYIDDGADYQGYDKIKLSNVIQDPSFVREVYSYILARQYMPASQANFANVYVNDTLLGLYTNVEAVNKDFLENHFLSNDGILVKCNPLYLNFTGENSNLNFVHGNDSSDYYDFYEIKSDYGWTKLLRLIKSLNNSTEPLEDLLDIDQTLWMHAFNYALVNFDSYVGYAQNYYLYEDDLNRFTPILWDLNMSIGSFRFADASTFWGGFSIEQAKTVDPLSHFSGVSVFPRPLMRKLFSIDRYRKMYLAHIRTIINQNISNGSYLQYCRGLQGPIDASVRADSNKFYTYNQFIENVDSTVNDLIDYPGIKDLMENRKNYLLNYSGIAGEPQIQDLRHFPNKHKVGDSLFINAKVIDGDSLFIYYKGNDNSRFTRAIMKDDGLSYDGKANDSTYGIKIPNVGAQFIYHLYAENDSSGVFSPERAQRGNHRLTASYSGLVINEIMADNKVIQDQNGEYDDWIELFNTSNDTLSTSGLYLSDDDSELKKYIFPDLRIAPGEYLIVWADEDTKQSGLHADFKLNADGDEVYLSDFGRIILDSVQFNSTLTGSTRGRFPNGTGEFTSMRPTFSAENVKTDSGFFTDMIYVYPNPSTGVFQVIVNELSSYDWTVSNMEGKILDDDNRSNTSAFVVDLSDQSNGIYILNVSNGSNEASIKLVKIKNE